DAAGYADLDLAGLDQRVDEMGGLLGRRTLRVDDRRSGVDREHGIQPGATDHVVRLLAGLRDAAADDFVDEGRVDTGPLEDFDLCSTEECGRVDTGEPAIALALRGTDGFNDDGVAHGVKLEHVLARSKRGA